MKSRLLRAHEAAYAALFSFSVKGWGGNESTASFLTACALAGAVVMNFALLVGLTVFVAGPLDHVFSPAVVIVLVAAVMLLHYALFVRDERYTEIHARFSSRRTADRRFVARLSWLYLTMSYVLPLMFAIVAVVIEIR